MAGRITFQSLLWLAGITFGAWSADSAAMPREVRVERHPGKTIHHQKARAPGRGDTASEQIRTYLFEGEITNLSGRACDELSDALYLAMWDGFPEDDADGDGVTQCATIGNDPTPVSFWYSFAFEAHREAGIPAVEQFVTTRDGEVILGETMHARRAFAVFAETAIGFYVATDTGIGAPFAGVQPRKMHLNVKQADAWIQEQQDSLASPDGMEIVKWTAREMDKATAFHVQSELLPKATYLFSLTEKTIVLDDRSMIWPPRSLSIGMRDCRSSTSGHCI